MKSRKILKSRAIFTGTGDAPFPGAVVVSDNRIEAVVKEEELRSYGNRQDTEVYDFGNKLIMPGFIDAHVHFSWGATASSRHMCTEIEKSGSEEECVKIIEEFAEKHPEEPRILGIGWFQANWNDAPLPTKHSLDSVIPDRPVYLMNADAHSAWLNSKALEECGINRDSTVSFGEIRKGADGEPDGMLLELEALMPIVTKMISFEDSAAQEMYTAFLQEIASYGITALSDMTAHELNPDVMNFFHMMKRFEEEGRLTSRLHIYSNLLRDLSFDKEKELTGAFSSDKLRYAGMKQFIDGVTSTYTGYLLEPYADRPETAGFADYEKEVYQEAVVKANKEGFGVRLHCIGDKAVRWALDIFEEANRQADNEGNRKKLKNAVEHIESIHPRDIPRFHELGVIASLQPYHLTLDNNEKISRIGLERCEYEWPINSLLESKAELAFGTDFPVISLNPFMNIYAAVTRCDDNGKPTGVNPKETISLAETLKAYTFGGAKVYNREKEMGTLEKGKLADVIVINKNLFEIPPEEIKSCHVEKTFFDGKLIYEYK